MNFDYTQIQKYIDMLIEAIKQIIAALKELFGNLNLPSVSL